MSKMADQQPPPRCLGDFKIVREIGRGGMGIVFEARQISLNRAVALKVLGAGLGLTDKAVTRFHREAEAAAKLHHTNIVPVYATGEDNGTYFYAMELIEGPSLEKVIRHLQGGPGRRGQDVAGAGDTEEWSPWLRESNLFPPNQVATRSASDTVSSSSVQSGPQYFDTVARLIAEVADALDYAHSQAVIHRDVKPSNLLLSRDGKLSLNDFGLARMLEQPGMTVTGEFMGTPRYMSPEQVAAGRIPLDHRTDIYSLGATLYELLTLHAAFSGERREQVLAQIMHKEPTPPRRINKRIPFDLETICLKALDKDPDRRYQTAGQMSNDLRLYLNRFAILARRAGRVGRFVKWARRRPGLASALAGVFVLGVAAGFFALRAHLADQNRRREAEVHAQQTLAEKRQNTLDRALLVAMSGDLAAAEQAIADAERVGASTGQVRILRGLLALHRGQSQDALRDLQQAVELLPDSVSALSLLAVAHFKVGGFAKSLKCIDQIQKRTLVTPEDLLFKGYAEGLFDPKRGLQTLDEAVRQHPSVIGFVMRAGIRVERAQDTGSLTDAELAVEDTDAALRIMPGAPVVLSISVRAHMLAAGACQDAGQDELSTAALASAADSVKALDQFAALPDVTLARMTYFLHMDQDEKTFGELAEASKKFEFPIIDFAYASMLYCRGEYQRAVDVLDKRRSDITAEVLACYILPELEGTDPILKTYQALEARDLDSRYHLLNQTILLFAGQKSAAIEAGLRLGRPADWPPTRQAVLDHLCGAISDDEALRATANTRNHRCTALFFIGLTKLADGNRVGARKFFEEAVATRAWFMFAYYTSRMFLARMNQDPSWPPWIPLEDT